MLRLQRGLNALDRHYKCDNHAEVKGYEYTGLLDQRDPARLMGKKTWSDDPALSTALLFRRYLPPSTTSTCARTRRHRLHCTRVVALQNSDTLLVTTAKSNPDDSGPGSLERQTC